MSLAIVVPVLWRPQRVEPTMASVVTATPDAHLLFVATDTDESELAELERRGAQYTTVDEPGTYARKINHGMRTAREWWPDVEWVFMSADDVAYRPGWYEEALNVAAASGCTVVGTNDKTNARTMHGIHSTHTLVHVSYIDDPGGVADEGPGSLLHEEYPHEYVDDEFIATACARHNFAPALGAVVEHLHHAWGKAENDATYELGVQGRATGHAIFRRRQRLWMYPAKP